MKKIKKSDLSRMFPDRPADPYCEDKKYSWNEMNNMVRAALVNLLKDIEYEYEQEKTTS